MYEICLLGTKRLEDLTSSTILDLGGIKPRQILEMLALAHRHPVSKEYIAEALWDGHPPPTYAATVESHVSVVRRHLTRLGVGRDAIRTVSCGYLLTDAVDVDVSRLRHAIDLAVQDPSALHVCRLSVTVPASDVRLLASSPYASWAIRASEDLDHEIADGLRLVGSECLRRGELERATSLLTRAQQAEPLSELTEQMLLETYAARGARVDALVSFARFRRRLREELGAEPGVRTTELHLEILRAMTECAADLSTREWALLDLLRTQLPQRAPRARLAKGA